MIQPDDRSYKEIEKMFLELSPKQQQSARKNAMRKASGLITKEARRQLSRSVTKKGTKYKDMLRGIRTFVKRDGSGATITIFGHRKYYWSFLVRFFETGTNDRFTRGSKSKKRFAGAMPKREFFGTAKRIKGREVIETAESLLYDSIVKTWNRKNGK